MDREIALRYGLNPHQTPARAIVDGDGPGPFRVLNGAPGYINLLDAISAWQLVRELRAALGEPAGASFKHVSPAGAGIGLPLSDALRDAYQVGDRELSPVATAYVRARGGDLVSSYGDVAAVSDRVDVSLAQVLKREVSDGIVAPAFDADALEILRAKKGGRYLVIEADPDFETPALERRSAFGLTLEAPADSAPITPGPAGQRRHPRARLPARRRPRPHGRDDRAALHAVELRLPRRRWAGDRAGGGAAVAHPLLAHRLRQGRPLDAATAPARAGAALRRRASSGPSASPPASSSSPGRSCREPERDHLRDHFTAPVEPLSDAERRSWIAGFRTVLSHDAFLPFRDNIDRAQASAVRYVLQPGGSIADAGVTAAADEYGMTMALSGLRLFRH